MTTPDDLQIVRNALTMLYGSYPTVAGEALTALDRIAADYDAIRKLGNLSNALWKDAEKEIEEAYAAGQESMRERAEEKAADWFMRREPTTGAWHEREAEVRKAIRALEILPYGGGG